MSCNTRDNHRKTEYKIHKATLTLVIIVNIEFS